MKYYDIKTLYHIYCVKYIILYYIECKEYLYSIYTILCVIENVKRTIKHI